MDQRDTALSKAARLLFQVNKILSLFSCYRMLISLASYEYKMCPPCRTRYRTYGNTKRAKWKAERDAFDREMATLRTMEDEKREIKGLRVSDVKFI
jgi:hypothetical protein